MSVNQTPPDTKRILKVAVASLIGSVIEQYDFLVTGIIAATIWGGVFFKLPGLAAIAAAITVYGLGIIVRPVGAFIFGNIADKYGRRDALMWALVLMGISTLAIGLTPSYDSIGALAPFLLIIFRIGQGISFGAEFGTASTWVVEHAAKSKYRAFWGSWVGFAIPIGLLLGFSSVITVKSMMSHQAFMAWGWRIFFFIGFLVAIVGIFIRMRAEDSYLFEETRAKNKTLNFPAAKVWREMPLRIISTSFVNAMFSGAFFLSFVFGTAYMKAVGYTPLQAECVGLIAAGSMLIFMICGSLMADKINRRAALLASGCALLMFAIPYFYIINMHNIVLAAIAEIIGFGFVFGFGYGAIPSFYAERFPTRYRASGANAGYQISQIYGGGLLPIIAGQILKNVGIKHAYIYIGMVVMVYALAAIITILILPDTTKTDLETAS